MTKVVGIRFRSVGKLYYFDPLNYDLKKGDFAVVETARGVECGTVLQGVHEVEDKEIVKPLKAVMRKATPEDIKQYKANREKEKKAFSICNQKIAIHNPEMKLVDVEYTFDGQKILFYFTADGRVDFRELVKDLAGVFRTRIELRQIGVRDESKLLGGLGMCGRPFCCSTFLFDFQPVSIKMAKEQGKSLNPAKISGACGRLMCCLKYEQGVYDDLLKHTPRNGTLVETPDGRGIVVEMNIIKQHVKVRLDENPDAAPKSFAVSEVKVIGKRGNPRHDKNEHEEPDEISEAEAKKLFSE